ncbi:mCG58131, partial [Mus musculus]
KSSNSVNKQASKMNRQLSKDETNGQRHMKNVQSLVLKDVQIKSHTEIPSYPSQNDSHTKEHMLLSVWAKASPSWESSR